MTETDYYCRKFTEIESEIREHNKFRAANPLFTANTHRVTVPKKPTTRKRAKPNVKKAKAAYAQYVADGICTMCRTVKAENGRLCTSCHEKQNERGRKRSAERSDPRQPYREEEDAA